MSKKIIVLFLGLSLFAGQSGILAVGNASLQKAYSPVSINTEQENKNEDSVETEQEKLARKKRAKAFIKQAETFRQQLVQGKVTEEQILDSIYAWRDGVKDLKTGKIVKNITPQEAEILITVLDLQELHEKREAIKSLMLFKSQFDQKKISQRWFKKCASKVILRMYQRGLITLVEVEKLKRDLGLISISQRVYRAASAGLNKALKISLAIGAIHCLSNLVSSSSQRLPGLIKALKTGTVTVPGAKYLFEVEPRVFQEIIDKNEFKIGFWDKIGMVFRFVCGINDNMYGAIIKSISAANK